MKFLPLLLFNSITLLSQSGYDIAKQIDNRPVPKNISTHIVMTLENSRGYVRKNKMISKSKDRNSKQIIWFIEPKDDKGVAFLKLEQPDKDIQMKMWLPAFKKVRRITAKRKGDSFMGSDLSFEDLSTRDFDDYDYTFIKDTLYNDQMASLLEIKPRAEIKSSYSKHIAIVDKSQFLTKEELSFNNKGVLEKKKIFSYSKIDEYFIVDEIFIVDMLKDHSTLVQFSNFKLDDEINNNLFHERSLQRLPKY